MLLHNGAIVADIPIIIKGYVTKDGRRIIAVEASKEFVDSEFDCIAQAGLLRAAPGFVRGGTIDRDHLSELGDRLGLANPMQYLVVCTGEFPAPVP